MAVMAGAGAFIPQVLVEGPHGVRHRPWPSVVETKRVAPVPAPREETDLRKHGGTCAVVGVTASAQEGMKAGTGRSMAGESGSFQWSDQDRCR